jgi:hypothetical protein
MKDDGGKGASQSLNKTITEIMDFLADEGERPGPGRGKLRPFLHDKIGDLAERWFKRGFNRGHIESHRAFKTAAKVPRRLEYECSRELSPGQERALTLKSTIKKAKPASLKKRA